MEIYKNDYKKEEDEVLWELHEIRNELYKELKNKNTDEINKNALKKHDNLEDKLNKRVILMINLLFICLIFLLSGCDIIRLLSREEYLNLWGKPKAKETYIITENPANGIDNDPDVIFDMAIDEDYIYLAGEDYLLGNNNGQMRLEKRYKKTGELITDFGNNGIIQFNYFDTNEIFHEIAIDSEYIYLACVSFSTDYKWQLQKRDINTGALIDSFGINGFINIDPSSGTDDLFELTIDKNFIYISGFDFINGSSNSQWHIEKRKITDGSLVTDELGKPGSGFSNDGIYQNNPTTGNDGLYAMMIDDNYIYATGSDRSIDASSQWRIEKINKTTGLLESSFGSSGVITENYGNREDRIYAITVDNNYIYVTGEIGWEDWATVTWRIEKRDIITGALTTNFGINGIIDEYLSEFTNAPSYMIQSNGYLYIVGWDTMTGSDSDRQWRIEKRNTANGSFDIGFGSNGIIQKNYGSGYDSCESVCVDNTFVYLAGYDIASGNNQWHLEKRYLSTGSF